MPYAWSARPFPGVLAAAMAALAFLVASGGATLSHQRIYPGVQALGQPLGGLTLSEAEQRVAPLVQSALDRPLQVAAAGTTWDTTARELGVRWNPAEVAQAAQQVGRSGHLLQRLADIVDARLNGRVVAVDALTEQAALEAALRTYAAQVDQPARNASLVLEPSGEVRFGSAQMGRATDLAVSYERVASALATRAPAVELLVLETAPTVPDARLLPAREQLEQLLAPRAGAAHLTLTDADRQWRLSRAEVARLLVVAGGDAAGVPATVGVDDGALQTLVEQLAAAIDQEVQDARFAWNGGRLRAIRESRIGRTLDREAAVSQVRERLLLGEREIRLPVVEEGPVVADDDPAALGIVDLIERGSTSLAGSQPEKRYNVQLAAERLNGVVVPPGGVFSFNDQLGPTTLESGFTWGFGIEGSSTGPKTVPSVAGGICQVATTLFQPVFWAGFALEERYAHAYWIPAYTSRGVVGLDAAVDAEANLDFRWRNSSQSFVLVEARVEGDDVQFALYGTKPTWQVQVDPPRVVNPVSPDATPIRQEEPSLESGRVVQVETAREGFEVLVSRRVTPGEGGEARTLDLWTGYKPSRSVSLVGTGGRPAVSSEGGLAPGERLLRARG